MKILYSVLAIIAAGNIAVAVFITTLKIGEAGTKKSDYAAVLYVAFTVLGIYAAKWLLN